MAGKPGRITDRIFSFSLYLLLMMIVIFVGSKLINYALDIKFYHLFLRKWETTLNSFSAKSGKYPVFPGNSQKEYMDNLVNQLQKHAITVPHSNTRKSYIYTMNNFNLFLPGQKMFILSLKNRIIIYNMPVTTFKRLDKLIDGDLDEEKGAFIGKRRENEGTYTGQFIF